MRKVVLKIMDSLMALFLAVVVGFFTHWLVGMAIGAYCLTRMFFPKPVALAPINSPARQKKLEEMRRREDEEESEQRFHHYGVYGSHLDDDEYSSQLVEEIID